MLEPAYLTVTFHFIDLRFGKSDGEFVSIAQHMMSSRICSICMIYDKIVKIKKNDCHFDFFPSMTIMDATTPQEVVIERRRKVLFVSLSSSLRKNEDSNKRQKKIAVE